MKPLPPKEPVRSAPSRKADEPLWVITDELLPGDAYQEGPYVVFTAQYHLRRGYCCNSGCRHCPYRDTPEWE